MSRPSRALIAVELLGWLTQIPNQFREAEPHSAGQAEHGGGGEVPLAPFEHAYIGHRKPSTVGQLFLAELMFKPAPLDLPAKGHEVWGASHFAKVAFAP